MLCGPHQIHSLHCQLSVLCKYKNIQPTIPSLSIQFLSQLGFCCLLGGTFYVLFRGEDTFIGKSQQYRLILYYIIYVGQHIQPNFDDTNPRNKAYFLLIIISFLLLSFLSLLTCLGEYLSLLPLLLGSSDHLSYFRLLWDGL